MRAPGNMSDRPRPIKRKYVMKQRRDLNLKSPQAFNCISVFCNFNLKRVFFRKKSALRHPIYIKINLFSIPITDTPSKMLRFLHLIQLHPIPNLYIHSGLRLQFLPKMCFLFERAHRHKRCRPPPTHTHQYRGGGRNT